jgi:hypothetical protein
MAVDALWRWEGYQADTPPPLSISPVLFTSHLSPCARSENSNQTHSRLCFTGEMLLPPPNAILVKAATYYFLSFAGAAAVLVVLSSVSRLFFAPPSSLCDAHRRRCAAAGAAAAPVKVHLAEPLLVFFLGCGWGTPPRAARRRASPRCSAAPRARGASARPSCASPSPRCSCCPS